MDKNNSDYSFDDNFPDGVFCKKIDGQPIVKVRLLFDYCEKNGIKIKDLSPAELEKFIQR